MTDADPNAAVVNAAQVAALFDLKALALDHQRVHADQYAMADVERRARPIGGIDRAPNVWWQNHG